MWTVDDEIVDLAHYIWGDKIYYEILANPSAADATAIYLGLARRHEKTCREKKAWKPFDPTVFTWGEGGRDWVKFYGVEV